ncbi:antibiotic biosynthesis monooxygenase [Cyanobacterium aponinum UTEX 3222]|uniref:Antibiotic biosynthesis monooxygenase n=2 Tax=Cyanobacterium aponinum TaxID=379064 RepID=A0A844GUZ9_9CHRO|nr:antibiotic biosynthesis monooxygenase [Cyanobacterium aponinum]WRL42639.1 antibiotic biosynthesis monooxygenase [Cyanobacterium aponinum UTEX 3222]MBD2395190.1 antibiotic biosynthesis monooxygenase [Cyanobacterium aponinum FACHB-4101]MTF40287.1 antibiotic biosynthesis monooxygenase [Cyanobacterium aponinum 0216]PHV62872.1 antibiotic biosynthesis monooxygenase [Cyanobacterium aponinum IPPAS B-1201]WPF88509.1 antibiotic biosynthesis monooxygenase [Cyanobacterium aponinum AL20115]
MQEFSDFLRHKCAYVATATFKPGKFPEAQKLFEEAIASYSQGFKGAYLFQKPNTEEGIAFIIWEKIEDMEENKNEVHNQIMEQMKHLFATPPQTNFYDVLTEFSPS